MAFRAWLLSLVVWFAGATVPYYLARESVPYQDLVFGPEDSDDDDGPPPLVSDSSDDEVSPVVAPLSAYSLTRDFYSPFRRPALLCPYR